jgi:serine/alanine adding enzyme
MSPVLYPLIEKMEYEFNPEKIDRSRWEEFVQKHPKGNIFQTPQMYRSYVGSKNYDPIFIACLNYKQEIIGLLVGTVFSERSGLAKSFISRSIVFGGPLLTPEVEINDFLSKYDAIVKKKAVYTRLINLYDNAAEYEKINTMSYKLISHLNYQINLTGGIDEIWSNIHNTRRRQIKRGIKRGVSVKISRDTDNLRNYYSILELTYKNAGLPLQDFSFFQNVYSNLSKSDNIVFFSAFLEDELIGHRIILSYKKTLYDWYAGDVPKARDKYTNDVLVWEVLKWGADNGYECFDFGGAGEPDKEYGVRDFKKKFGGKLVSYGNYMKIHQAAKYRFLQNALKLYRFFR